MAIGKQKKNIKKNKAAIRNRRSEKNSQTMAKRKEKNKKACNDLQSTPQKTKDQATRTTQIWVYSRAPEG
jgi:hypothetical protein